MFLKFIFGFDWFEGDKSVMSVFVFIVVLIVVFMIKGDDVKMEIGVGFFVGFMLEGFKLFMFNDDV